MSDSSPTAAVTVTGIAADENSQEAGSVEYDQIRRLWGAREANQSRIDGIEAMVRGCSRNEDFVELRQSARETFQQLRDLAEKEVEIRSAANDALGDVRALEAREFERGKEIRSSRRATVGIVVSAVIVLVLSGAGALWYVAQLDTRDRLQNAHQVQAIGRIENKVTSIDATLASIDSSDELAELTKAVKAIRSEQPSVGSGSEWFFVMQAAEQRRFCRGRSSREAGLLPVEVRAACRALR